MRRPRKVFGRRIVELSGARYRFELRPDGLFVRKLYARQGRTVSFWDLLASAEGQKLMPL